MIKQSLLIAALLSVGVAQASEVSKHSCKRIEAKIDHVNSQMRAGYTLERGERLKEEFRRLKKIRNKCKKKRFPTK